ncbi:MAG TPA: hypothetical protein VHG71_12630 [Verrucomicrobiae bacterium]|nr:hypothetical protein [Verrucomicrobiae bacterium]
MIRVVQSILLDKQALEYHPDFLENLGLGLLVTVEITPWFDVEDKTSLLVEPNSTVKVHRPDGSVIERVVSGVEPSSGPRVGLFFSNTEQHEIPKLSEIELLA